MNEEAWFNIKVAVVKATFASITTVVVAIISPWLLWTKRADIRSLLKMYNPFGFIGWWRGIFGETIERNVGCKWVVADIDEKSPPPLPDYCFWDSTNRVIFCLRLSEATMLYIKHSGTLYDKTKYYRERKPS